MKQYETVIGLEVHVELATKTKIFCGCSTAFGGRPNSHTCPVCTGMPGALPVLNRQVVEYAMAVGLATGCTIAKNGAFDRKNYFYPDNPQNYQISQLYFPLCRDGGIEIETAEGRKTVRIHEIHMEEDAGKLVHEDIGKRGYEDAGKLVREDIGKRGYGDAGNLMHEDTGERIEKGTGTSVRGAGCSFVDYNRSGVPLIEIVSEPDMRTAEEVIAYLEKLRLMIQYLGASDCKMQEGSMRVDVNLSVREAGTKELGTRTEMKNLNSFRAITRAVEGERSRQIELLERGERVVQETRRWDDSQGTSYPMRSKEDAQDYRYFPEPDLVRLVIDDAWIERVRKQQPEMREEKRVRYQAEFGIPEYDAGILTGAKHMADIFEETVALGSSPKEVSNWLMVEAMRLLKEAGKEPDELRLDAKKLAGLIGLVADGKINRTVAKEVFEAVFKDNVEPAAYVAEQGLLMVSDDAVLREAVERVIAENPKSVVDYRNGKDRAMGFLVGCTMKVMKGKADPGKVNALVKEMLERETQIGGRAK